MMTTTKPAIDIVDVFASVPGKGNPVAVVYGCFTQPRDWQQSFSHWIGLPETVFVDTSETFESGIGVRIFSPLAELPFAGHPAIGTVRSLLDRGVVASDAHRIILRCQAGNVDMAVERHVSGDRISFTTLKPATLTAVKHLHADVIAALGGDVEPLTLHVVDTGARWLIATLADASEFRSIRPDLAAIKDLSRHLDVSGISVVAPTIDAEAEFEVRSFAPMIGVPEDAVCGGGNASVAAAISASRNFIPNSARYIAMQGGYLGRDGRIFSEGPLDDRRFSIGGEARVIISGDLHMPAHLRDGHIG